MCNGTKEFLSSNGFAYLDHPLADRVNVETMKALSRGERGIPLIVMNGVVTIGFDRHRLKQSLGVF